MKIDYNFPLHDAAVENDLTRVQDILTQGIINIDTRDIEECTALMLACNEGNIEIVRVLLASGANVNLESDTLQTALHLAVGYLDIVKCLVEAGANINAKDIEGNTPIEDAIQDGHIDTVRFLLSIGANLVATIEIHPTMIMTNLHLVFIEREPEMYNLLYSYLCEEDVKEPGVE